MDPACSHRDPAASQPIRASKNRYYMRNRACIKANQSDYNYVKRCGRRKISKAARHALEASRRREIYGIQARYLISIVPKAWRGYDPSVKPDVRQVEQSRRVALRARLSLLHSEKPTRKQACSMYAREVEAQLLDTVDKTKEYLEDLKTNPFTRRDDKFLHRQRRLVAGYHQELEFIARGDEAYEEAITNRALVLEGHRVDRAAFQRLYGW